MEQQIEQIIQQLASQIEAAQVYLNLLQAAAISQPTTSEPDPKNSPADCPAFEIDLFSKNTKWSNQREDFKEISTSNNGKGKENEDSNVDGFPNFLECNSSDEENEKSPKSVFKTVRFRLPGEKISDDEACDRYLRKETSPKSVVQNPKSQKVNIEGKQSRTNFYDVLSTLADLNPECNSSSSSDVQGRNLLRNEWTRTSRRERKSLRPQ
jgi:hypothetical protein